MDCRHRLFKRLRHTGRQVIVQGEFGAAAVIDPAAAPVTVPGVVVAGSAVAQLAVQSNATAGVGPAMPIRCESGQSHRSSNHCQRSLTGRDVQDHVMHLQGPVRGAGTVQVGRAGSL